MLEERAAAITGTVLPPDGGFLTADERRYVSASAVGLTFSEETPYPVWKDLTERLLATEKRIHWYIADAINFGERKYGEMYSQAMDATGLKYGTLRNITSVAGRFELSRRRDNLTFWDHSEVAKLEAPEADALLDEYEEQGWTQRELREKAQERKQAVERERALSEPTPDPLFVPRNVRIEAADARSMPLLDARVHLIVTSPPYGVDLDGYDGGEDILAGDWPSFMLAWLADAFRVTAPNGRLALNVPLDTTRGGFRPTYAQAVQLADAAGWEYRSTILWIDDQLGKSTARGSLDSAAAPHVIAGAEAVALFSKGAWRREPPCESDLAHDEWLSWTNGVWRFPGETQAWEGHPASFPYELPRRLIKLLSFPGDVVLDPFVGSGTTALAAHQLGRDFLGFDRSIRYVESALRRVVRKGAAA